MSDIANKCPSCGWKTLFVANGGWLTCGNLVDCKLPDLDDAIEEQKLIARESGKDDAVRQIQQLISESFTMPVATPQPKKGER